MIIKLLIKKLTDIYWKYFRSPEYYARHIGVQIGKNCFIATRNFSSEPYLITVGNNVMLTKGVSIHTHGGANAVRHIIPDFDVFGKVVIEDNAYIGSFSQIMPGVTIGEGSIVAAGSVVTKSIPPRTVFGGNPARFICTIQEYIDKNIKYDLGSKQLTPEQKKELLLSLPDSAFIKK